LFGFGFGLRKVRIIHCSPVGEQWFWGEGVAGSGVSLGLGSGESGVGLVGWFLALNCARELEACSSVMM
jgi:hypothetical protein